MKLLTFKKNNFYKTNYKVLADWCLQDPKSIDNHSLKRYENKIYTSYHWNDYEKLKKDRKKISFYVKKISKELIKNLNKNHNVNYPDYYWSTIILPWLYELISNLFDKWEIIRLIKNKKKIEILLKKFKEKDFNYEKSDEFDIHAEDLNNYILTKVVNFKYKPKFKKIKYFNSFRKKKNIKSTNNNLLEYFIFKYISKINENKNLFHGINFDNSIIKTCEANIRNFQLPIFYYEKNYNKDYFNKNLRKKLFKKNNKKDFLEFCREEISLLLPKSFLEDFDKIKQAIEVSYFPRKTNKIFTSFNYRKNDFFQIWCAEQRLKGSKYMIFQHGGGYGYGDFTTDEEYIDKISDKFLTWGWKSKNQKFKKFYCTKISNDFNHVPYNTSKILLCLHTTPSYSFRPKTSFKNNLDRLKSLQDFKNLSDNIKNFNLTIRYLSRVNKEYKIAPYEKYFSKKINFDHGEKKFLTILNNYNLVVHDSFETTFLETLAYNIPTIVLIRDLKKQIKKSFFYDFEKLKKIKVIHEDYYSVQKMINNKNFSINDWWFDVKNQFMLEKFRKKFVKKSDNLLKDIGNLIN